MALRPVLTLAFVGLLLLVERFFCKGPTDWKVNLQAWGIQALTGLALLPFLTIVDPPTLLRGGDMPFWLAFPLYALVFDLCEYLYHRAQHRIPLLWAMHSLHHSDPNMSAFTTQRHFWGDQLIKSITVWLLPSMLIAPTPGMVFTMFALGLWNFVVHAAIPLDFGRWSWLLNCPAYHLRHHSRLPQHFNSNFAALFPIWDVIAGSYFPAKDYPPTGLDEMPRSAGEVFAWPLVYARAKAKTQGTNFDAAA